MAKFKAKDLMIGAALFFIVCILAVVFWSAVAVPLSQGKTPSLSIFPQNTTPAENGVPGSSGIFSGPLTVNMAFLNHGDNDAVYSTANGTGKLYHADGTLLGTMTSAGVISGNVIPADNGVVYLQWQPASTVYLDAATTAANSPYLEPASPQLVSGIALYRFPVNVADLKQISGITTTLSLNMYLLVADVSGLTYTSQTNATSADYSGTAAVTSTVNGYISGLTQKDAFKITKIELSMPDAANISMLDSGKIKNLQVSLGLGNGQSWQSSTYTHSTGGTYVQFATTVADPTQEYYGVPVLYATSNSAIDISYSIRCDCANFAASGVWSPSLIVSYIGPDGTPGSITRQVAFTDT